MGFKDRIQGIRQHLSTPMSVWMADLGSDPIARSGGTARVVVKVDGENDGSIEGIDLKLRYNGIVDGYQWTQLAEVPMTVGVHELDVQIPTGLPPSVHRVNGYTFFAKTRRTKGLASDAQSAVDTIGRPEDLYWPEGARSGQDGLADDVRIEFSLDTEVIDVGGSISGQVTLFALREVPATDVDLVLGAEITSTTNPPYKVHVKFKEQAEQRLRAKAGLAAGERVELPFKIAMPPGLPPTVHSGGDIYVVWRLEARFGKATAWRVIGVLDPDGTAGNRHHKDSSSILIFD